MSVQETAKHFYSTSGQILNDTTVDYSAVARNLFTDLLCAVARAHPIRGKSFSIRWNNMSLCD